MYFYHCVKLGNFDLSIVEGKLLNLRSKKIKLARPLNIFGSIKVSSLFDKSRFCRLVRPLNESGIIEVN